MFWQFKGSAICEREHFPFACFLSRGGPSADVCEKRKIVNTGGVLFVNDKMMSDRERSVAGNWLHEKIFRTEKLSDLLALSPCIEAGKCPHDRTNGDKNDKHCACQQQKDCVYHNRRVITERRCRFPKHHSTKRNHQLSFQQGNPTKNGILAKQIIKADKGISILPTMVAKRNSH